MNAVEFNLALNEVDQSYIQEYLTKAKKNTASLLYRITTAAACLVLAAVGLWLFLGKQIFPARNESVVPTTVETNSQQYTPQEIEAFTTPELEALYRDETYSELLPRLIPSGMSFKSTFLTESGNYLLVQFESPDSTLDIQVSEYDGSGELADPEKPETYRLDLHYGPQEQYGTVSAELPNVFLPIRSTDVTHEIAAAKIYTYRDGLCKASIDILFGDYIVHYAYNGKEISADVFYEMITSSNCFADQK